MGVVDIVKITFIPALIAAALYFGLAYVVVPLIRKYRQKYSNYLPMDSIGQSTFSLRERATDVLAWIILPRRHRVVDAAENRRGSTGAESLVEEEAGDRMFGFDGVTRNGAASSGGDVEAGRGGRNYWWGAR